MPLPPPSTLRLRHRLGGVLHACGMGSLVLALCLVFFSTGLASSTALVAVGCLGLMYLVDPCRRIESHVRSHVVSLHEHRSDDLPTAIADLAADAGVPPDFAKRVLLFLGETYGIYPGKLRPSDLLREQFAPDAEYGEALGTSDLPLLQGELVFELDLDWKRGATQHLSDLTKNPDLTLTAFTAELFRLQEQGLVEFPYISSIR